MPLYDVYVSNQALGKTRLLGDTVEAEGAEAAIRRMARDDPSADEGAVLTSRVYRAYPSDQVTEMRTEVKLRLEKTPTPPPS